MTSPEGVRIGRDGLALENEVALHRGSCAVIATGSDHKSVVAGGGEGVGDSREWRGTLAVSPAATLTSEARLTQLAGTPSTERV